MEDTEMVRAKSLLAIIAATALTITWSSVSRGYADAIDVAADGSARYKSIQKAIDAAPPNAIIRIGPGVYEENVNIGKPLTLEGAGWQKTTVLTVNRAAQTLEQMQDALTTRMQQAESDELRKRIREQFEADFKARFGRPTRRLGATGSRHCGSAYGRPGR